MEEADVDGAGVGEHRPERVCCLQHKIAIAKECRVAVIGHCLEGKERRGVWRLCGAGWQPLNPQPCAEREPCAGRPLLDGRHCDAALVA